MQIGRKRAAAQMGQLMLLTMLCGSPAIAGEASSFTARQGLDLAQDAAGIWASDAVLIYLENDEPLNAAGTAARWGYLFFSAKTGASRSYTLRGGKVLEAADLDFDFSAPPLPDQWLDSTTVLATAFEAAGREYCADYQGSLATMFLIRGAFHEKDPDRSTWAVVYTADNEPNLMVIVDATEGKVVRKWKG